MDQRYRCVFEIRCDEVFSDLIKTTLNYSIKNRARIYVEDTRKVVIEAKDFTSFKAGVNSVMRIFSLIEDASKIE